MTEQTMPITRDDTTTVAGFVAAVRRHLADLPVEEQQELTEGLAADLGDLVAEQGADALGDPAAYARELRTAAGLAPVAGSRRLVRAGLGELLDRAHERWDRWVSALPGDVGGFLLVLRPAWWVARAWTALALGLTLVGHDGDIAILPTPGGSVALGLVLLVGATVASVQVGRGRLWPGAARERGSLPARIVLLGLNLLAVVFLPVLVGSAQITRAEAEQHYADPGDYTQPGLVLDGNPVQNIYPYDAQGHPLVGIQLVDQDGRRVAVRDAGTDYGVGPVLTPWTNGRQKMYSVFPMPSRRIDTTKDAITGTAKIRTPFATLPPVTLEGYVASLLGDPAAATKDGSGARTGAGSSAKVTPAQE